jgi:hypothetical protein
MMNRNYTIKRKIKFWHFQNLSKSLHFRTRTAATPKRKKKARGNGKSRQDCFFKAKKSKHLLKKAYRRLNIQPNKKSKLIMPFALIKN